MGNERVFTVSQVAQHKSREDCWIIINGRVLDVTKFLEEHPGGEEVLLESAGRDATTEFEDTGHSKAAKASLINFQVGFLQGHKRNEGGDVSVEVEARAASKESNTTKEIKAFVIKEDPVPKYRKVFVEFFVPLLVAGLFSGYRYLTGAAQLGS